MEAVLPDRRHLVGEAELGEAGLERGDVLPAEAAAGDLRAAVGLAGRREVRVQRGHVEEGRRAVRRDERGGLLVVQLDRPVAVGDFRRVAVDRDGPRGRGR